jgi:uncharacterized membrane protein
MNDRPPARRKCACVLALHVALHLQAIAARQREFISGAQCKVRVAFEAACARFAAFGDVV